MTGPRGGVDSTYLSPKVPPPADRCRGMDIPAVCCGKPCSVVYMTRGPLTGCLMYLLRWADGSETWLAAQFVQLVPAHSEGY